MRKIITVHFVLLNIVLGFSQVQPQIFEPGLISNDGVFGFTLSPRSDIALWVNSNGRRDTLKIMESRKVGGKWSDPKIAPFSSSTGEWKDIDPIFSPDGNIVLFQSNRNTGRESTRNDFDIWVVNLTNSGWGEPFRLSDKINSEASESYASIDRNKTIYFMKENPDGRGQSDIYFAAFKNGEYQAPENIGFPINTINRESNPYISPNGDYIIYFSSDDSGYGDVDLVISVKKDGKWTTPKNLGIPINSTLAEFCPFFHERERKLYFSRQEKKDSRMIENIYSVNFDAKNHR